MIELRYDPPTIILCSPDHFEQLKELTSDFAQHYLTERNTWTILTNIKNFPKLVPIFRMPKFQLDSDTLRKLTASYNAHMKKQRTEQRIETESADQQQVIIEIKGNWLHLKNLPEKVIPRLDMELSYDVIGSEHSESVKKGLWDGRKHLLRKYDYQDEKYYRCRKGLLERVGLLLLGLNITPYHISHPITTLPTRTINARYKGPNLWKHQEEALVECLRKKSGIISIATGGGKTVLMTRLVESYPYPTNVFINSVDVGRQLYAAFAKNLGDENVGFIGDSSCDIVPNRINIILLPTAFLALWSSGVLKRWKVKVTDDGKKEYKLKQSTVSTSFYASIVDTILNATVSFYDECDYLGAETYSAVSACTKSAFNFGFSATPYRNDGKDLEIEAGCGRIIYTVSASDLIDQKVLVPPEVHIYAIPRTVDLEPNPRYPSIFKRCIKENSTRDLIITQITKEFVAQGRIGIILVNRIDHGKNLLRRLTDHDIKSRFIYGQDSTIVRTKAINMLKNREINVIITTLFGRGVDIPEITFGIRAKAEGSTKTNKPNSDVIQALGRILRVYPGKDIAYWVDFIDPYPYLRDHSQSRLDAYQSERNFTVILKEFNPGLLIGDLREEESAMCIDCGLYCNKLFNDNAGHCCDCSGIPTENYCGKCKRRDE